MLHQRHGSGGGKAPGEQPHPAVEVTRWPPEGRTPSSAPATDARRASAPSGRAWKNDLSKATITDNFCNRWSGGLGFLNHAYSGSEVSIEPDGAVYPCCVKTKLPIGNLLDEPLIEILDSLAGEPAYEAINAGHPERMGISHGWSMEKFLAKSRTLTPAGKAYENPCIGCDRFHQEVLGDVIARAQLRRTQARAARLAVA